MADLVFNLESESQDLSFQMDESITKADLDNAVKAAEEYRDQAESAKTDAQSASSTAQEEATSASASARAAESAKTEAKKYYDELKGSVEEITKINSALSELEYSEVAGGVNLFDEKLEIGDYKAGDYEKVVNAGATRSVNLVKVKPNTEYFFASDVDVYIHGYQANKVTGVKMYGNNYYKQVTKNTSYTTPSGCEYIGFALSGADLTKKVAIIEGNSGSYIPYIPSVKMLAEENTQLNSNLLCLNVLGYEVPEEAISWYIKQNGRQANVYGGRIDISGLSWGLTGVNNNVWRSAENTIWMNDNSAVAFEKYVYHYVGADALGQNEGVHVGKRIYINNNSTTEKPSGYMYFKLANPYTITIDGNEAITKINRDLSDNGITPNVFDGKLKQGLYAKENGNYASGNMAYVTVDDLYPCKPKDVISVKYEETARVFIVCFYNSSKTFISGVDVTNVGSYSFTAPDNAYYYAVSVSNTSASLTPATAKKIDIHINNAIDEINANLSFNGYNQLTLSSGTCFYAKVGHIAHVICINMQNTPNQEVVLGTLPEGYKPARGISFVASANVNGVSIATGSINTNGDISLNKNANQMSYISFNATYFC